MKPGMGMALALAAGLGPIAAGCPSSRRCGTDVDKAAVLDVVDRWYLYPGLLPASRDPGGAVDAQGLLDSLTANARAAGMDRGWSYVTTIQKVQQHYAAGQAAGYGFGLLVRGSRLFVGQVMKASAAADAGFARGDELLRLGPSAASLAAVADLIASGPSGVSDALASGSPGITRVFEVSTAAGGVVQRTVTTRTFDLDPVPAWHVSGTTGYLDLRTFIQPAEAPLQAAFAAFRDAGVTDLVVDLRYNGGGLISTARLLANLIGGDLVSRTMYEQWFNPAHSADASLVSFAAVPQAAHVVRVAFLTTALSASASELVVNVLDPWVSVALVGEATYGKPVGQLGFQVTGCDTVIYLVGVKFTNASSHGDYYAGLPDGSPAFRAPLCPAPDDLGHAQDDPAEASHAAALAWLQGGTCPAAPAGPTPDPSRAPLPRHPGPSAEAMPGLH